MKHNKLLHKPGIYQIKNLSNGKIYIGSSVSIYNRYYAHINLLKYNKHHNNHLQRAWNKCHKNYEVFEFTVLEYCEKSNLINREQFYLDKILKAKQFVKNQNLYFRQYGYNILPYADSRLGSKQTSKSVRKSVANNPNRKEVISYSLDGKYLKEHFSIAETARYYNLSKSMVYACCMGKTKYSGNYYFIFKKDFYKKQKYISSLEKNPISQNIWNKDKKYTQKEILKNYSTFYIYMYDIYGKLIKTFKSQQNCGNYFNTNTANISRVKNTYKLYNNYYLFDTKFINFDKFTDYNHLLKLPKVSDGNIQMYDPYGKFITSFNSIKQCSKLTNLKYSGINSVLVGSRKFYKHFKFMYREDIV